MGKQLAGGGSENEHRSSIPLRDERKTCSAHKHTLCMSDCRSTEMPNRKLQQLMHLFTRREPNPTNQPICRGTLFCATSEQIPASKPSFKKEISAGNVNTQKGRCCDERFLSVRSRRRSLLLLQNVLCLLRLSTLLLKIFIINNKVSFLTSSGGDSLRPKTHKTYSEGAFAPCSWKLMRNEHTMPQPAKADSWRRFSLPLTFY